MTKKVLIERLKAIAERQKMGHKDEERDHGDADMLLLSYINDKGVQEAYDSIEMWYA